MLIKILPWAQERSEPPLREIEFDVRVYLDVKEEFTYLGCNLTAKNKFNQNTEISLAKGKRASFIVTAGQ